jgi:hypothetical protein
VAGACVTILKAWFDTKSAVKFSSILAKAIHPVTFDPVTLVGPSASGLTPIDLTGDPSAQKMTLQGELNKLAANVAMGRSMGGVHWRTDNTRSLRLGERIATIILRRQSKDYQEQPSWAYTNFDGNLVTIDAKGRVGVSNDQPLETFYNKPLFKPLS